MFFFHKKLVKTAIKGSIFCIFTLYCEGCHFSRTRFEIVKLDKILDPKINFKSLY